MVIILWEIKYILEFDYCIEIRMKLCVIKIYELCKNKWGCFVVWIFVGWVRVWRSKCVNIEEWGGVFLGW